MQLRTGFANNKRIFQEFGVSVSDRPQPGSFSGPLEPRPTTNESRQLVVQFSNTLQPRVLQRDEEVVEGLLRVSQLAANVTKIAFHLLDNVACVGLGISLS